MKKLLPTLLGLIYLTSSFGTIGATNPKYESKIIEQERSYRAYINKQNKWLNGYVNVSNGKLTDYQFDNIDSNGSNQGKYITGQEQFYTLNPNNQLAINYNFTHYVDIAMLGRVYIISN